ncbi:TetR family transcriptional regulator [Sulfobacillus thermotolerans]|uniref:TetR family transcriptional regulator n=1 Tax=Sulfobacillus thermotolerans TaxID=338644 RepID=A0ABM6RVB1_9FIRM|nr:TetR family transcriptional regulator [Sulfobacillus thermotolerans]
MEMPTKRLELLYAAARAFAEQGFDSANINEIASQAGLGKGTVYLYFANKKALYLGVIEYTVTSFNNLADHIMALPVSNWEKIEQVVHTFLTLDEEFIPFLTLWARHQFHHATEFQEDMAQIFSRLRQPLCEIVAAGVEQGEFHTEYPETMGYVILSLLAMLVPELQVPYGMPTIPRDQRSTLALDVIRKILGVNLEP